VKLGVQLTRLNEARLAARAAELARERVERRPAASMRTEVDDGKRELGAATGGLRGADER
jgi:hypothetical protein